MRLVSLAALLGIWMEQGHAADWLRLPGITPIMDLALRLAQAGGVQLSASTTLQRVLGLQPPKVAVLDSLLRVPLVRR